MNHWVDAFLNYQQTVLQRSPKTIEAYERDLRYFLTFADRKHLNDLNHISESFLNDFLMYLSEEKQLHPNSMLRACSAIRSWLKFLIRQNHLPDLVLPVFPKIQRPHPLPKPMTQTQVVSLIQAPDLSTPIGIRDRAFLELMYASGLRVSELIQLKITDIDFQEYLIRVLGKGNKTRVIPFSKPAKICIDAYIQKVRPSWAHQTNVLFLSHHKRPLTRQTIWHRIKKYAQALSIEKISPHTLRHSFATHVLQGGADLRSLQDMLGHASLSTTQIYTSVDNPTLKKVFQATHPRAKK